MNMIKGLAVAAAVCALTTQLTSAQELKEIKVEATRVFSTKTVAHNASTGAPILDVSLSYHVKTDDLDLASHYGPIQLEKRIRDVAAKACREIGEKYPDATPSEQECTQAAAAKAMTEAHQMEAVAKANAK